MDECQCGHDRSAHANGLWRCKWCRCSAYVHAEVPDLFDDFDSPDNHPPTESPDGPT